MTKPNPVAEQLDALIGHATELADLGQTPATGGNFSIRMDAHRALVTRSGCDKGRLRREDFLAVSLDGHPEPGANPASAETGLHLQLYRHDPGIGCVLHTHSRNQTVASRLLAPAGRLELQGWELQKALRGVASHEETVVVPILANSQDMADLADRVRPWLDRGPRWGYLIEGHGLYAWGADPDEARRHLDALEFLLGCELELRRLLS